MARLKYYSNKTNQWEYADNVSGSNIDLTNYATKTYVDNSKVAIDTTLQIQGQAADAKAVGEAIKQIASDEIYILDDGETIDDAPKSAVMVINPDGYIDNPNSGGSVDLTGYATEQWVKEQNYLTVLDKPDIVAMVIESLGGNPVFGYVDENNNIIVRGDLPDGIYTVKYNMEDGNTVNIGNLVLDTGVYYTNLLSQSVNTDGSDYRGTNGEIGYNSGYKISVTSGEEKEQSGACVSGFIPLNNNGSSRIRIKNISLSDTDSINNIVIYDENKTKLFGVQGKVGSFGSAGIVMENDVFVIPCNLTTNFNPAFMRFSCGGITSDTIVTLDEEIVDTPVVTPVYTNFADYKSADWQEGYRLSTSSGGTEPLDGHTTTNYIPCKAGDTLRVKGLAFHSTATSGGSPADPKIVWYKSDKEKITGAFGTSAPNSGQCYGTQVSVDGDISTYTVAILNDGVQYANSACEWIRIDGFLMDGYTSKDVIITVNEEIMD